MISRQYVVSMLRKTGFTEVAEDAARELPESVDLEQVEHFCDKHGITRDMIVSMMGGSP
jgi:hypothetical protein